MSCRDSGMSFSSAVGELLGPRQRPCSPEQTKPTLGLRSRYRGKVSLTIHETRGARYPARRCQEAPRAQQHVKQRPRHAESNGNRDGRPLPGRGRPNCISAPSPNARASRDASNELLHASGVKRARRQSADVARRSRWQAAQGGISVILHGVIRVRAA